MSEPKLSETKPKKMVRRSVAIALGIVCIVLIAGLVGAIVYYNSYVDNHHNADNQYNTLQSQMNNLTNIVNLANYTLWVNVQTINLTAGSYTSWNFSASLPGYILVDVESTTSYNVEVTYTYAGSQWWLREPFHYDQLTNSPAGIKLHVFPILPATVQIRVGNPNLSDGPNESVVAITYVY